MDDLVASLQVDYPQLNFVAGNTSCWSPVNQEIIYQHSINQRAAWTLLHELGHALLGHITYGSDFALLQLEVAAWYKAQKLQKNYNQKIDQEYVQNCLDTYREWLHRRSTCPECNNCSVQSSSTEYRCFNCHTKWQVTSARFCRPYRRVKNSGNKKSPELTVPAIFM